MAYDGDSIFELDKTLPLGTESKSFGDNAIREIKNVLKTSFPNSPVSDVYDGTLTQLSSLASGQTLPRDMIIMWAGNETTQPAGPAGWTICDGRSRKSGGGNSPDLRTMFILGANAVANTSPFYNEVGDTGGNGEIDIRDINSGNLVKFNSDGHALTVAEIPAHQHAGNLYSNVDNGGASGPIGTTDSGNNTIYRGPTQANGGNAAHVHNFSIDGSATTTNANLPPWYALLYLIKD